MARSGKSPPSTPVPADVLQARWGRHNPFFTLATVSSLRRSNDLMADHQVERASTTEGLPVSPSLGPALEAADVPSRTGLVDSRTILMCLICVTVALAAALVAQFL